jgi:hypothetical protein
VQYNACMIQAAETAFSNIAISDQPPTLQPMVAWSEVVR